MEGLLETIVKGGPALAAIVFMFIVYFKQPKPQEFQEEFTTLVKDIHEMVIWTKDVHDEKDLDGHYTFKTRPSTIEQQGLIKEILQDIHKDQKLLTEIIIKLNNKIT